ncbi:MAG: glycosyltransferase family 4 protein [Desulfitobacteriaceae bacterium]
MRILMLTQYFPPETGAAQVRLWEVAKGMWAQGHQVEVVTAFPNHPEGVIPSEYRGKFFQRDILEGIPVYRTWIYPVPRGRFWQRLLNYFSFVFSACYGILKSGPADYIFVESPPLFIGFTTLFARRVKRAKVIFNVSDLWPESAVSLGLVNNKLLIGLTSLLEKHMYKIAWRISTQTEGIISSLRERGLPAEKLVFLPNGVDPDLFAPQAPDLKLAEELKVQEKFVVLYAGTMGYAHGLEVAVQAAEILKQEKAGQDIVFLLVGDGSERPKLEEMARSRELDNVRWVPFQPIAEMARYYSLAAVNLSTLRRYKLSEGVRPSKVFPGLASAKPLLYVGEGEGAKIVEESGGGVVIAPEDPALLARALLELKEDPTRRVSMGQKGREFVIKHYAWQAIVERWLGELGLEVGSRKSEVGSRKSERRR